MWLEAAPIKILSQRDNGGGVIEIPICTVTADDVDMEITVEMLREVVANFDSFPVVPVSTSPHREFEDRGGFSAAFVEGVELRGNVLFGRIDMIAELFNEVVEQGGWRGFSVELAKNLTTQAKKIIGWVLHGGVFTNRPAVDAHFKIAAEGVRGSEITGTYTSPLFTEAPSTGQEKQMTDDNKPTGANAEATVTRVFHDEKIEAEQKKTLSLEAINKDLTRQLEAAQEETRSARVQAEQASNDASSARNDKLSAEAQANQATAEAKGLRTANEGLKRALTQKEVELQDQTNVNLSAKVLKVRDDALQRGVVPALFDGIDADPAAWMSAQFASFEAFENHYATLSGVSRDLIVDPAKSGHDASDSGERKLDDATAKRLKRMGIDPKFVGIKSEAQLRELDDE